MLARYTADAWRGRVYAVRYFLLFISAAVAIGMISLLHERGGFALVLAVNAAIALAMFVATAALAVMFNNIEARARAAAGGVVFSVRCWLASEHVARFARPR